MDESVHTNAHADRCALGPRAQQHVAVAAGAIVKLFNENESELGLNFQVEAVCFQRVYKLLALTHWLRLGRVVVRVLAFKRGRRVKGHRVSIQVGVVGFARRVESLRKQRGVFRLIMLHFARIWLQTHTV